MEGPRYKFYAIHPFSYSNVNGIERANISSNNKIIESPREMLKLTFS